MRKKKDKIILPPELPLEIPDDEVEVSDDDLQFIKENCAYASLVSTLDTHSITNVSVRAVFSNALKKEKEETGLQVDRVAALPIKTLDGKIHYGTATKTVLENDPSEEGTGEDVNKDKGMVKLTKAEKRAKLKKMRKEAKQQGKEVAKAEVEETPQAAVLAEVKEDLTAEEAFESKKHKLELGNALLTDPDYRIRLPTEKELEMKVSKTVRKMRYYESTLLSAYKVEADYKAASLAPDVMEKKHMQAETVSAVFETYFRILKHTMQSINARPEANTGALSAAVGPLPLLAPCLKGLAKFSHLIDLDFMGDPMNHLRLFAFGGSTSGNTSDKCSKYLIVSEHFQYCIVAFKVTRNDNCEI
ncbi:hypothetical protein D0Y65_030301 [Glycine soja]|uniref:Nucleolar complex-associated protein 3 N-terminal domain-containing protein n=1 Tax=Glycine soja TaxID=3848 RepID=A0A445I4P7_GLYSO|nr:hypothetical protein D0Y65_030301 [Glycine soja]